MRQYKRHGNYTGLSAADIAFGLLIVLILAVAVAALVVR